ncbi:MAG: nucleoside deaminase [Rikenellaceae bacterium]
MEQEKFMNLAIELSQKSMDNSGGPFGAVIVRNGEIIASASNGVTSKNDPTAHAEVEAIRLACQKLNTYILDDCEIYSSCEPCPMCLGAIYWSRIKKLYFACDKTDAKNIDFDDSFIYDELKLEPQNRAIPTQQIMQKKAQKVFENWLKKQDKIKY